MTTLSFETVSRLGLAWLALAVVMSVNGIFRELVLRRTLGPQGAPVASAALGIALVLLVTRVLFPPLNRYGIAELALVSAGLVALTVAFETALGLFVDHKSWSELVEHYDLSQGELWPIVLSVLALTPFIWGQWLAPGGVGRSG